MPTILKNLLLENFQIHKEKLLEFSPGVNTIVGETEAGKSSIVRALDLILRNQPRGGEKEYQSDFTDDPLRITLEDNDGNIIEKGERAYKLNGDKLAAVGSSVPDDIYQLFPMKDINFQFQLDPYFIVLDTGGKAAEILNKATGFSEQEAILSEIKSRQTESRRLLKSLIVKKEKIEQNIENLKNVPRFLMRAKAIIALEREYQQNYENLGIVEQIAIDLSVLEEELAKYANLDDFKKELEKILADKSEFEENEKMLAEIKTKRTRLRKLIEEQETYLVVSKHKETIESILSQVKEHNEISHALRELIQKKNDLDTLNSRWMKLEMIIDELRMKKDDALLSLKICPLCGSELKGKSDHGRNCNRRLSLIRKKSTK